MAKVAARSSGKVVPAAKILGRQPSLATANPDGIEAVDDTCRRALDAAELACDRAHQDGTESAIAAARAAVTAAWRVMASIRAISQTGDAREACHAIVLMSHEGRTLVAIERAVRRLEQRTPGEPASETRIRRAARIG